MDGLWCSASAPIMTGHEAIGRNVAADRFVARRHPGRQCWPSCLFGIVGEGRGGMQDEWGSCVGMDEVERDKSFAGDGYILIESWEMESQLSLFLGMQLKYTHRN
jgi:hypothetical protein